jgi:acyl phosphate:glycerol-3-phosphate acyltransferase
VSVCTLLWGERIEFMGVGGVSAVIGHDVPVWLAWKGGRGLATSAGIMSLLGWMFILVWCSLWSITFLASKSIHKSNILATVVSPLALYLLPEKWLLATLPSYCGINAFLLLSLVLCLLALIRHIDVIKEFWRGHTQQSS